MDRVVDASEELKARAAMADALARWDEAVDSDVVAVVSWSFLDAAYEHGGSAVSAVTADAVREMLERLASPDYRWRAEALVSLWCFGSAVGVWRDMAMRSGSPGHQVMAAWEDRVEEQLAQGVTRFRELLGDEDPEVRSVAALALSCSSTDAGADFELLRDRFGSEPVNLAKACMGEAVAILGVRHVGLGPRLERFAAETMRTETDLVRYRTAEGLRHRSSPAWSDRAAEWEKNANVGDLETKWLSEA